MQLLGIDWMMLFFFDECGVLVKDWAMAQLYMCHDTELLYIFYMF
jgi:hypothetical protein